MPTSSVLQVDKATPEFERIVPRDAVLEEVPAVTSFAEGPVWNAREGCLLWTDAFEDRILRWVPSEAATTFLEPTGQALALTYDQQYRLVVTGWTSRTVWRLEPDGQRTILASQYQGQKLNTPNDLVVKSDGSIYWTDPASGLTISIFSPQDCQQYRDVDAVFRLAPDGPTLTMVADDFGSPNGLAFSPDEALLYVNDIQRRHIRVFDVLADGTLANGRLFYQDTGEERGNPDGMKVDSAGNVYCTGSGGIHVIDPRGNLLGRLRLPAPTNMCFGDADWKALYVTARHVTYRIRLNVAGVPVPA